MTTLTDDDFCIACRKALKRQTTAARRNRYLFGDLAIDETREVDMPRINVAPAASQYGRRHGMKFKVESHKTDYFKCFLTRIY